MVHRVERKIGGDTLTIETGKMGKQASGSVLVRYGDTVVFCAAVGGGPSDLPFFPLTVNYREKSYAAGKIPGGFFKREGRPSTKEILTMRLIDRPIRPLFPEGYKNEVGVYGIVLSADKENDPDILAMAGASASLALSHVPFQGPTGSVRMGMTPEGEMIVNPTVSQLSEGVMDLVVSGTRDAVTTVECGGKELPEEQIVEALEAAHAVILEVVEMQEELVSACGKEKEAFVPAHGREELYPELRSKVGEDLKRAITTPGKLARKQAEEEIGERVLEEYCPETESEPSEPSEPPYEKETVKEVLERLTKDLEREIVAGGTRADGRGFKDIRPVSCEVGLLPRTHGSGLFTRGETQALVVVTLGTELDEQVVDGLEDEYREKLLLHYDFPAFCVGETWPDRGPKRREIGHGSLARRALEAVMPSEEDFPYTIRVNSDILESNGSSSMATVCGASLALMDAGVPVVRPVAGIAMGMVKDGDDVYVLSDIQGSEDHHGDLDFKVAGSTVGVTALQLDCKVKGIGIEVMREALEQAREARIEILKKMTDVMPAPRSEHSPYAPRVERVTINPEKVGRVIGPMGRTIRKIQEETGTTIAVGDEGVVSIWGRGQEGALQARRTVENLCEDAEVGKVYQGKVTGIKDFGCFVEIIPGQEGLVHISDLAEGYVEKTSDVVSVGDEVRVRCVSVGDDGKIKLTMEDVDGKKQGKGTRERSFSRSRGTGRSGGRERRGGPRQRKPRR